jgi:hypothetical protein
MLKASISFSEPYKESCSFLCYSFFTCFPEYHNLVEFLLCVGQYFLTLLLVPPCLLNL